MTDQELTALLDQHFGRLREADSIPVSRMPTPDCPTIDKFDPILRGRDWTEREKAHFATRCPYCVNFLRIAAQVHEQLVQEQPVTSLDSIPADGVVAIGHSESGKDDSDNLSTTTAAAIAEPDDEQKNSEKIQTLFYVRSPLEKQALAQILGLPFELRDKLLAALQEIVNDMRICSGPDFVRRDLCFHKMILSRGISPSSTAGDLWYAPLVQELYEFIARFGPASIQNELSRLEVCDEHQSILNALRAGDLYKASAALQYHLDQSPVRLLSDLLFPEIVRRNKLFFDRMGNGHKLLFFGKVPPVEWEKRSRALLTQPIADAINRGAAFFYMLPAQSLLNEMAAEGLIVEWTEENFRILLGEFKSMLTHCLAGTGSLDDVRGRVDGQVECFFVEDDFLVPADNTCGLFMRPDGDDLLTWRAPNEDGEAWPEIKEKITTANEKKDFARVFRQSLEKLQNSAGFQAEAARRVLRCWFVAKTNNGATRAECK